LRGLGFTVFVFFHVRRTRIQLLSYWDSGIVPSILTLSVPFDRDQRGNCSLLAALLHAVQSVFIFLPCTGTYIHTITSMLGARH
jgi:hypothetical protein